MTRDNIIRDITRMQGSNGVLHLARIVDSMLGPMNYDQAAEYCNCAVASLKKYIQKKEIPVAATRGNLYREHLIAWMLSGDDVNAIRLTHIYLMFDPSSGLYKIGRSSNPITRLKGVQKERSLTQLIYTSPKCAVRTETTLHKIFAHKRIIGEWFDLSDSDIEAIRNYNYQP